MIEINRRDIKTIQRLIGKAETRLKSIKSVQIKERCDFEIKSLKKALNAFEEIQKLTMANKKKYDPITQHSIQLLRVRINKYESYKQAHPNARIYTERLRLMYEVKKYLEANKDKPHSLSDFPQIDFEAVRIAKSKIKDINTLNHVR